MLPSHDPVTNWQDVCPLGLMVLQAQMDVFNCESMPDLLLPAECDHQTVCDAR